MSGLGGILNEQTLEKIGENLDDDDIHRLMQQGIQKRVVPILQEIRQRRDNQPPAEEIREQYRQLPDDAQQDIFQDALMELVEACWLLRNDPQEALQKFKTNIRNPHTMEALLLIFQNDDYIDPEYSEQMKETGTDLVQWVGVALAPEMYDVETVERVADQLDLDIDRYE